jgi:hypothetical protein
MRIDVEADDLDVSVDALALVEALAASMPQYYAAAMLRGRTPDGGAMPTNKAGKPLGLGDGTIPNNWWTTSPGGSPQLAGFSTGPYQEGGYFYPVRSLVERGASPVGAEGKAGDLIDAIVSKAADKAVGL